MATYRAVWRNGFTLAELLVASVVMATCLLGVSALFRQAMDVEGRASIRWNSRASAEAIASHLAATVENATNLPGIPALLAESDQEGNRLLICQAGPQRRRYRWYSIDAKQEYSLELRSMTYAGTQNVSVGHVSEDPDSQRAWNQVKATIIGKHIDSISVSFRPLKASSDTWRDRWKGSVGEVGVRIRVRVGQETVERIVVPQANTSGVEGTPQ